VSDKELNSPNVDLVFDGLDTFAAVDLVSHGSLHWLSNKLGPNFVYIERTQHPQVRNVAAHITITGN
jgi:hypothetical protein